MKEKHVKTKKMKLDVIWYHAFYTLDDLYHNYCYDDKKFNKMLYDLLMYVDNKISPPNDLCDIVDRYIIVEYEEQ